METLRALILTPHRLPNRVAGWQQAICLVVLGKGDVLEEYEATVSSPSVTLRIPAVVCLRREVDMYKTGIKFSRQTVLLRDGYRCCYCGKRKRPEDLNYDHVLPSSRGGKTTWTNIVTSCYPCNTRKGRRTPEEAGMRMHFRPHRPKSLPAHPILLSAKNIPALWTPYLAPMADTA